MRSVCILVAALSVAGCGKMQPFCSPTERVRVTVEGQAFSIPVDLKPSILGGAAEYAALPSFLHQDAQGRRAYCQSEREGPTHAETFSFYPRDALPEVHFVIVGRKGQTERRQPDQYPLHNDSGFEVTVTKGPKLIYSPAGGVRQTAVGASCMSWFPRSSEYCTVGFTTLSGVPVRVDIVGEQSLSDWPAILARVDAYVRGLET